MVLPPFNMIAKHGMPIYGDFSGMCTRIIDAGQMVYLPVQ
jgi:hypothetical protein